jgi:hypothetical protein
MSRRSALVLTQHFDPFMDSSAFDLPLMGRAFRSVDARSQAVVVWQYEEVSHSITELRTSGV